MSKGIVCSCSGSRAEKMKRWRVLAHRCSYSAFNGYRRAESNYSHVKCDVCEANWRTDAAYVDQLVEQGRAHAASEEREELRKVGT